MSELKLCLQAACEILDLTSKATIKNDVKISKMAESLEAFIDVMIKKTKAMHIQRVQKGNCTLELGFVFNECLGNFERVADHCSNIAVSVLEIADSHVQAHSYLHTVKKTADENYHNLFVDYSNKFDIELAKKEQ